MTASRSAFWLILVAAVVVAALLGLGIGPVRLTPSEVWAALGGRGDITAVAIAPSGLLMLTEAERRHQIVVAPEEQRGLRDLVVAGLLPAEALAARRGEGGGDGAGAA